MAQALGAKRGGSRGQSQKRLWDKLMSSSPPRAASLLKNRQLVPQLRRDPPPGIKEHHPSEKDSKSRGKVPLDWAAAAFLLKQGAFSRLSHGLLTHGLIFLKPTGAKTTFSLLAQSSTPIPCSDQHPVGTFSPSTLHVRGNSQNKNCSNFPTSS